MGWEQGEPPGLRGCRQRGAGVWASPTRTKEPGGPGCAQRSSGSFSSRWVRPQCKGVLRGTLAPQRLRPQPPAGSVLLWETSPAFVSPWPRALSRVRSLAGCPQGVPRAWGAGGSQQPPPQGPLSRLGGPPPVPSPEPWAGGALWGGGWLSRGVMWGAERGALGGGGVCGSPRAPSHLVRYGRPLVPPPTAARQRAMVAGLLGDRLLGDSLGTPPRIPLLQHPFRAWLWGVQGDGGGLGSPRCPTLLCCAGGVHRPRGPRLHPAMGVTSPRAPLLSSPSVCQWGGGVWLSSQPPHISHSPPDTSQPPVLC